MQLNGIAPRATPRVKQYNDLSPERVTHKITIMHRPTSVGILKTFLKNFFKF